MLAHRIGALLAAAAMAAEGACATQTPPQPPPAPPPDASQKLVDDLTQWLHLDTPQQEKTRQLAREMQKRNEKIQQRNRRDQTGYRKKTDPVLQPIQPRHREIKMTDDK